MMPINNKFTQLAGVVLTCAAISACSPDVSNPPPLNSGTPSSGDADFTAFVSIGDSLTAGYADAALYLVGQTNSFPNILAQQFSAVGGGAFTQPLVDDDLGGLVYDSVAIPDSTIDDDDKNAYKNRFVLNTDPDPLVEDENPSPERLAGIGTTEINSTALNGMIFNNMGVPGAKSFHLGAPGYGNVAGINTTDSNLSGANPYFVRFSKTPGTTVIADASIQAPSFYTMWIGNNDVLSFATSGGYDAFAGVSAVDQTGNTNPATYGPNDITDPGVFAGTYAALIGAMTAANSAVQGVLINIPDVKTIPFFTTVPYNAIPMDDQAQVDQLNAGYAAYNAGVAQVLAGNDAEIAKRTISFELGQNAIVIEDETLTDLTGVNAALLSIRQATAEDLILLPASAKLGELQNPADPNSVGGVGPTGALLDSDVLIPSETQAIDTARIEYNKTIEAAANADANLVFFDAAAALLELSETGIDFGTGSVNADFVTGGAFSLDGVHPTGRGYAVIANGIIDVINTGFDANVHKVDPVTYPTVFLK